MRTFIYRVDGKDVDTLTLTFRGEWLTYAFPYDTEDNEEATFLLTQGAKEMVRVRKTLPKGGDSSEL